MRIPIRIFLQRFGNRGTWKSLQKKSPAGKSDWALNIFMRSIVRPRDLVTLHNNKLIIKNAILY